jgi:hypothetical protein
MGRRDIDLEARHLVDVTYLAKGLEEQTKM